MNKKEKEEWAKNVKESAEILINLCEMNNEDKKQTFILKLNGEKENYYICVTKIDKKEEK